MLRRGYDGSIFLDSTLKSIKLLNDLFEIYQLQWTMHLVIIQLAYSTATIFGLDHCLHVMPSTKTRFPIIQSKVSNSASINNLIYR